MLYALVVATYALIFLHPKGKSLTFGGNPFKIKIIDLPPDDKRQRVGQPSGQTPQGSKPTVAQNSPQRAGQSATAQKQKPAPTASPKQTVRPRAAVIPVTARNHRGL
jgi:hypothetical protein